MTIETSIEQLANESVITAVNEAKSKGTYGHAINWLKSQQDKTVKYSFQNTDSSLMIRANATFASSIYAEAISKLNSEMRDQKIQKEDS